MEAYMIVGLEAMPPPPPSRGSGITFGILEPGEIFDFFDMLQVVILWKIWNYNGLLEIVSKNIQKLSPDP